MRLFLAIDLPSEVKEDLERQIEPLKKQYPQFSWVAKNNYHLTIYFFGEVNNPQPIIQTISDVLYDQSMFYLYSINADLFINEKIVLYLNFRKERKLIELEGKISRALGARSVKKFIPHLTLARYRIPSKQQYFLIKKKLSRLTVDISFPVKVLTLFSSTLGGKQPVYKTIKTLPLLAER